MAGTPPTSRLKTLLAGQAWVAFEYDGDELAAEHGGAGPAPGPPPVPVEVGQVGAGYDLMLEDEPGFWEQLGYHDYGDPWREQRYQED